MSAGYTQEQDGSRSMRRLLALYYSLLSGALLVIGALTGITAGIYGGLGCALVVLVLLGLTTISDLRGINYPVIPDGSSGVNSVNGLPKLRQNSDSELTDFDGKVDKVSTTMTGASTSDAPGSYEYRRWE